MAWGGSTKVAQADVEFHAETGKFEADVRQAASIYSRSIDKMSDEALRMSVAQEKLDRAIHRFGPESIQARTAAVALRKEMALLRHEEDRVAHSARRASNDLTRVARGSIAASGAFKGLGNALFFASGAFAGGFGIIYALRTTIQAAGRAQVSMVRLSQSVKNAGIAWGDHRKEIIDTIDAQSKLTSFDDEELQDSFGRAIIRTKDLSQAFRLNGIAADYARASGRSLEQAMTLVLRASLGQTASLRRLGIEAEKVTTEQDKLKEAASEYGVVATFAQKQAAKAADERATKMNIIATLEAKLSGQSEKFAKTAQGRQERFNKVLEDTQEIVGLALLPTVNNLLTRFSEWLDAMNKTGETQREVNRILKDAGTIVGALADAFKEVKKFADPLVDAVGGLHNAVEGMALIWVAFKVKAIAGFVATQVASKRTATMGIVDATAFGRAWDVATRPRNMVVTTTTTGTPGAPGAPRTPGAPGAPGAPRGGGSLGRGLGGALGLPGLAVALGITLFGQTGGDRRGPLTAAAMDAIESGQKVDPAVAAIIGDKWKPSKRLDMSQSELDAMERKLTALAKSRADPGYGHDARFPTTPAKTPTTTTTTGGGGGGKPPPRTAVDISLDLSRAQAQGDESAEIKYHRELAALYKRQADRLEGRKNLTLLQKQKLTQLYGQIDSEEAAIESIVSGQQSEARAKSAARAAAARRRHDAHKTKIDTRAQFLENQLLRAAESAGLKDDAIWAKRLMAHYRRAANDEELTAKERQRYEAKRLGVRKKLRTARAAANEVREEVREQKLINIVAAKELTKGKEDDKVALRNLIAYYRAREKNTDLAAKERADAERKRIAAQKKLSKVKKDSAKEEFDFVKRMQQEQFAFLTGMQGLMNDFGSNLLPGDFLQLGTHAREQTILMRAQNDQIAKLAGTTSHPNTRYAHTELAAAVEVGAL